MSQLETNLDVTGETFKAIRTAAFMQRRSESDIIRAAVREYLDGEP